MSFKTFRSQTWALIKKNLIIICVRSWFTTLLRYLAPIAFITVLWHIPSFIQDDDRYGMGSSASIQSLSDALGKGKLVMVKDGTKSAPDLQRVLDTITKPLRNATMLIGPQSANKSIHDVFVANQNWYWSEWAPTVPVRNTLSSLVSAIETDPSDFYSGGMWVPGDNAPTVFVPMDYWTPYLGMAVLNSATQARSGINITGSVGELRDYRPAESGKAILYIIIVCLLQTLYPAFFSIYPAYERRSQVRALQYSNGVRPAALLTTYLMFEFIFVMVITAGCTALMNFHAPWWHIQYVAIVMALYGLTVTLFVYLISHAARSQPGAFIMSFLFSAIMHCISVIGITVVNNGERNQGTIDAVGFGLGAIFHCLWRSHSSAIRPMEEADALFTRSAIIAKRMLAIGSVRQLREAFSNEYHVQLVLRSSPTSSKEEMEVVASWVRATFGSRVQMDGKNLGGQVRFIVPVDNSVPYPMTGAPGKSFVHHMIDTIENNKDVLGVDCYSINTATMETVFLSVVKNSGMDEVTSAVRRKWWQF